MQENEQLLTVARLRAEAEDIYGQKLGDIETATNRIGGGYQRDDGASVKKVQKMYAALVYRTDMSRHTKVCASK